MSKIKDAIYMPGGYVYNCHYHLIWVTKYRKNIFINENKRKTMLSILKKIAKLNDITIHESEVMPDHIHLLISFPPRLSGTNVVKALKVPLLVYGLLNFPKRNENYGADIFGHDHTISEPLVI